MPNIETPLNMSLTPPIDPVAAPLLGQHTKDVLRKTLGYDDRRIAALAEAGSFRNHGEYRLAASESPQLVQPDIISRSTFAAVGASHRTARYTVWLTSSAEHSAAVWPDPFGPSPA